MKFGRSSNIRSVCAYGGAPKSLQVRKIQGGIEVLIATPGRLNDLLEMRVVDLSQVVFLGKCHVDGGPQTCSRLNKKPVRFETLCSMHLII